MLVNRKFCDNSFSEVGSLKRHINTVNGGNKDYKCESCEKSFPQKRNLKRHAGRHVYIEETSVNLVLNSFSQTEVKLIKKFIEKMAAKI